MAEMAGWYGSQYGISVSGSGPGLVTLFFAGELGLVLILLGSLTYLGRSAARSARGSLGTVSGVLGAALRSRKDVKIGAAAGLAYVALYSVVSSVVVYQPGVDFAQAYGLSGPASILSPCCGTFGGTPSAYAYLPQGHLALQILPMDLLMLVVIPFLVGVNVLVASFALRSRPKGTGVAWIGGMGAMVGLFTSCPTCAGYFLAGAFGGLGATGLAVALGAYQAAFILLSIPLLVGSPFLVALSLRRAYVASCALPGPSGKNRDLA